MIQQGNLPVYVKPEFHRAIKYSQQWQYECVAKPVATNNNINIADLNNEELSNHIHWEHSRHLSAQNNQKLDDHIGKLRVDLGIDHDWTTTYFDGVRSIYIKPPLEYTHYLKNVFYGNYW